MALYFLNKETLPAFMQRIEKLSPDSERQFGTLDVVGMMRHMRNALETALGEVTMPDDAKPVIGPCLYFFITHIMTEWPKGKIKAPDYWTPPAEYDYAKERELFLAALNRFVDAQANEPHKKTKHPMLGTLTLAQWSRLNGIHLDHHLKQFAA